MTITMAMTLARRDARSGTARPRHDHHPGTARPLLRHGRGTLYDIVTECYGHEHISRRNDLEAEEIHFVGGKTGGSVPFQPRGVTFWPVDVNTFLV
jgi:hypothetical protein